MKNNYIFCVLTQLGLNNFFYKFTVNIKSIIFKSQIIIEYNKDLFKEYSIIKPFLPSDIKSILDIGCGVAGIDVLLSKHYENNVDIFLLDKTSVDDKVYYHFEKKGSFYNSLNVSKDLLEINGIKPLKIHLQEATDNNRIKFNTKFDLIISFISWGFHYPISTYLDEVYEKLSAYGVLIVDIRRGTGEENEIREKFGNCNIIFKTPKLIRVLALK
ncbi:hypothetical protein [Methanobacterium formicicum]|uniref:hypothetical protein n=1 Tax=Methanobacterium formicicum TaxID=2162 RepID=UPI002412B633|nr:hypothetical protein [Methanobacterium formicicum]MDG3547085.1 hypothetical protein [Methanobacterium formicicum]